MGWPLLKEVWLVPPFPMPNVPVKEPRVRQVLLREKQPAVMLRPFANVEVALPVCAKFKTESPPENVDVEVLVTESELMVVVPAARVPEMSWLPVVVAPPKMVRPFAWVPLPMVEEANALKLFTPVMF